MSSEIARPRFPSIGMSPAVWGPIFWTTMHIVSLGYPSKPSEEDKAGAVAFFNSLSTVIPCPICKTHYKSFLAKSPVESAINDRQDLIHWVFDMHNNVNVQLGKRAIRFDEYVAHMQSLAAAPNTVLPSSSPAIISLQTLVAFGAIVGIAGGAYYYYTKK